MEQSTGNAGVTIGKLAAAIGITQALSAGFNLVKDSVQKAFGRIDTMEQFERVMTTMTGSSSKANEVLDTVNDTVKGTAYGLDVAAKATQDFVTSNMDVDKATDTISSWGDAVAFYGDGSNETFSSVSDALAKMVAKGKVQMDTMNRLTEAGIPAMQIYADATNQSVEEVAEAMSKGELDADHFIDVMNDALSNGTENFAGIAGAAKEAGASWGGTFDNMKAAVARGVESIITSTDEMLTSNSLPDMREMVSNFGSAFEDVLNGVAEKIPEVVSTIQDWRASLEPLQPIIMGVATSIAFLVTAAGALGTVRGVINGLTGSVQLLGRSFGLASGPMLAIIAVLALVGAAVGYLWQTNEEFRTNMEIIWTNIQAIISAVWEAIQPGAVAFISILTVLIGITAQVIAIVASVVASFTSWIVSFIETHSWVMQLVSVLGVVVTVVASVIAVVTVVAKVFAIVVTVVKAAAAIFMFFTSPVGIVIAVVVGLIGVITWLGEKFEWIGNIVETVSSWVSNAWNGFLDVLGFGTKEAADEAGSSIEGLSDTADTSTSKMAESAEANIGGMHDSIDMHFGEMNQFGTSQLMDLHMSGASELEGLNAAGSSSVEGLSVSALGSMDDMYSGSVDSVSGMNTDVSSMLADLESSGSIDIESLSANVTGDMSDMSSSSLADISNLSSGGASDFSGMESEITSSASNMQSAVENSFKGMSSSIESEMSKIESASKSSLNGLSSSFSSSMKNIANTIQSAMKNVANQTQLGMRAVTQTTQRGMQQTTNVIQQSTSRMNSMTNRSMRQMIQVYTNGYNQINRATMTNMNRIVNVNRSGMSSVTSAFRNGMNQSAAVSQSTGTRIVSIFNRLQAQLRNAGVQAMEGLRNGLNSSSGGVMATARNIANRVASTIRSALKVHSPSRVTTDIGENTGEGLVVGLWNMSRSVEKASMGLALAAVPDVRPLDIAGQINGIHARSQRQFSYDYQNELNVNRQPARITLVLGNNEFEAFVDDINEVNAINAELRRF